MLVSPAEPKRLVALEYRIETNGSIRVRREDTQMMDNPVMGLIPDTPLDELLDHGYVVANIATGLGACGYPTIALWSPYRAG